MKQSDSLLKAALEYAPVPDERALSDFWVKSVGTQINVEFRYFDFSTHVPVNDHVIFYECMAGARVGDNPLAIFEYLLNSPKFSDYLHVWSLDASATIPTQYRGLPNVVFARRRSLSYLYFLACAGHIVCNATLPAFFTRRPEQRYLNTWHGVPYKALGRATPNARFGPPSSTWAFLKATHILSTCEFMTDAVISAYSMSGTSTAKIAETGYPRVDLTVNYSPERVSELRHRLGLAEAGTRNARPVVLYAPTWRAEDGQDVVDTDKLLKDIKVLSEIDADFMYRGHHRMNRILEDQSVGDEIGRVIIPSHEISSNDLLAVVDILITDYSSIYFDFLPTGRPIIHYLYDLQEYQETRGLNLGLEDLPGRVAQSSAELLTAISEATDLLQALNAADDQSSNPVQGARYKRAQERFCPHEDGRATQRAVEFFFGDAEESIPVHTAVDARPTTVYWAGPADVATETDPLLRRAISAARAGKEQVTLVIGRDAKLKKATLEDIRALRHELATIPLVPAHPAVLTAEQSTYQAFCKLEGLTLARTRKILQKDAVLRRVFTREYRRRMDDAQFDRVFVAPKLPNHELAMAVLAERNWRSIRTRTRRQISDLPEPLKSGVKKALPPGSARRRLARRVYRPVRGAMKRLRAGQ